MARDSVATMDNDVTLAAYDLIPALAVQPGQTTVLTNPSNVVEDSRRDRQH